MDAWRDHVSKNKFFKYHIEFFNIPASKVNYLTSLFMDYSWGGGFSVQGEPKFTQTEDGLNMRISFQSSKTFDRNRDTENNIYVYLIGKEQFFSNIFYQLFPEERVYPKEREDGKKSNDFPFDFKAFFIDNDKRQ